MRGVPVRFEPGVAERAAAGLQRRAPGLQVCGTADGYAGRRDVIDRSGRRRRTSSRGCLGNPLQEHWIEDHLRELDLKLVWGAGGALDFYSGDVPLAPDWVQRAGFEWLFRLVTNFSVARLKRQRGSSCSLRSSSVSASGGAVRLRSGR